MSLGTPASNVAAAALAVEGEIRCIVPGLQSSACGRVITLNHNNPDINEVIAAGFNRLVIERSMDGGITYSEATTGSERPVLEIDKVDYVWRDRNGDPTCFYRFRYINTHTKELCDPSDPVSGAALALAGILSVAQLKQRYMFGVDLTDDAGNVLPDSVFEFYILSAIEWMEHELDIRVLPTNMPNERHDYYREDYAQFNIAQLDNYPVISLDEFRVQYPSGQNVIIYPDEWVRLDKTHGIVRIVPTAGTLSEIIIGQGGSFLPAVFNGMSHLPDLFEFDYVAGFECIPANILNLIGMAASMGPFNIFGDLIAGAGIANVSLSIDGLSQSIGTTSSATNCLCGESEVTTHRGPVPIEELVGESFHIWDGIGWYDATAVATGEREIAVTRLSNGKLLRSSPDHRFRVLKENVGHWVLQKDLQTDDVVLLETDVYVPLPNEYEYPQAKVVEAWSFGEQADMYDVQVHNDRHLFFANGIGVHNSGYGARIIQYGKQIKAELPTLRRFYKGIRMISV